MERDPPVLDTPRLVVRMPTPADVPAIARYYAANREHLAPASPTLPPEFFTEGFWHERVRAAGEEYRADRSVRLFLFDRADTAIIVGNANFTQILRAPAHYCVLGYGLAKVHEGRGLMQEALEAAIGFVFDALNLHRVMANYVPRNERSGRLLRRLGFQVEGYARDYLLLDGRWEDHVLTSRTNENWRAP